ncbi:MAG: hypothetical protein KBT08_06270 [Bacteroidales bacterium]|nr:hypothetical protein [Candidatus Cryptobacteroides onthequi]
MAKKIGASDKGIAAAAAVRELNSTVLARTVFVHPHYRHLEGRSAKTKAAAGGVCFYQPPFQHTAGQVRKNETCQNLSRHERVGDGKPLAPGSQRLLRHRHRLSQLRKTALAGRTKKETGQLTGLSAYL